MPKNESKISRIYLNSNLNSGSKSKLLAERNKVEKDIYPKLKKKHNLKKEIVNNLANRKTYATSGEIIINEEPVDCLIDSGAQTSFLSETYSNFRKLNRCPIEKKKRWITANGTPLETAGQTNVNLKIL